MIWGSYEYILLLGRNSEVLFLLEYLRCTKVCQVDYVHLEADL